MRAPSARTVAWVLAVACGLYLVLIARQAWALIATGDPVVVALGLGIAILPVIGVWVVVRELQFGARTAELGRELAASGALPEDDLPRTPGGRVVREAADACFAVRQAEVESNQDDWGAWFRLAIAYDDAGDRRQARAAMRTAIAKHRDRRPATTARSPTRPWRRIRVGRGSPGCADGQGWRSVRRPAP